MTTDTPTIQSPLKTNEEIEEALRKILNSNGIKKGSKTARTIECSFLQGMMVADSRYVKNAYIVLCLYSGRSILD